MCVCVCLRDWILRRRSRPMYRAARAYIEAVLLLENIALFLGLLNGFAEWVCY